MGWVWLHHFFHYANFFLSECLVQEVDSNLEQESTAELRRRQPQPSTSQSGSQSQVLHSTVSESSQQQTLQVSRVNRTQEGKSTVKHGEHRPGKSVCVPLTSQYLVSLHFTLSLGSSMHFRSHTSETLVSQGYHQLVLLWSACGTSGSSGSSGVGARGCCYHDENS